MTLTSASQHLPSVKQLNGVRINIILRLYIECRPIKYINTLRGTYQQSNYLKFKSDFILLKKRLIAGKKHGINVYFIEVYLTER